MCVGRSRNVFWSSAKAQMLLQASRSEAELRTKKRGGARRGARLTAGLGQRPRSGLELGLELVAEEWRSALSAAPFPPSRKSSSAGSFAGDPAEAAE